MKNLIYFISGLLLFSCSPNRKEEHADENSESIDTALQADIVDSERNPDDQFIEDFTSDLRVGKTDWNEEDVFIDTLEFIEFNQDGDYEFVVFRTSTGKEFYIKTAYLEGENNETSQLNWANKNRNFAVKWKIGKFSEAGLGEAIYFSEAMVSIDLLRSSHSLKKFLDVFFEDYRKGIQLNDTNYLHPYVDLVSTFKIGLYCVIEKEDNLPHPVALNVDYLVTGEKPKGDFCSGYQGAKDGLYYKYISIEGGKELPSYEDMTEDGITRTHYLSDDIAYSQCAKVLIISEGEFNRYLYFFKEIDQWYFWIEDFCDCSA